MAVRSTTYRNDFFKNNKGIFGIYFCYLCRKPLTRKYVEVDHIVPISNAFGTNSSWNLDALCKKCNRKKSNKVDARIIAGYTNKLLNTVLSIPFIIIGAVFSMFFKLDMKLKIALVGIFFAWLYIGGYIGS